MTTNTTCFIQLVNEDLTVFFEGERLLEQYVAYREDDGRNVSLDLTDEDRRYLIEWLGGIYVPKTD